MNRFRDMFIQSYTRRMTAAILDLVQTKIEAFDPPIPKALHKTKDEADRMIHCRDDGRLKFSKMRGQSSVVDRSVLNIYIDVMYSSSLR